MAPRAAELPTPVRAIIGAAIVTSYEGKVRPMAELARPTSPSDTDEIDAFRATGNSPNTGIKSCLTIARQGINWRHILTSRSAIAIIDPRNTSIDLVNGLDATIHRPLKARFSYAVDYGSNPAAVRSVNRHVQSRNANLRLLSKPDDVMRALVVRA